MLKREQVGLCWDCRHRRRTGNRRGSIFYFCGYSKTDARFPKYPPLPVFSCPAYEHEQDPWSKYSEDEPDPSAPGGAADE